MLNKVGCTRKVRKPCGHSSGTHWMFEHRTEVCGGLSLNPQRFSKVDNGHVRTVERSTIIPIWYSEIAHIRRAGAGTAKYKIAS